MFEVNVEDCLKEGLLDKAAPDAGKAKSSLEMAKHKLGLAEEELRHKLFESAVISAYSSMFHSARSLLFRDGFKERSHYAVYVYVSEKYSDKIERKYVNELNSLRLARHGLMYGLETGAGPSEFEARDATAMARGFLEAVKKLVP